MNQPPESKRNKLAHLVETANVESLRGQTNKSGPHWHTIMKEGGGNLAAFTDELFSQLEKFSEEDWKEAFMFTKIHTQNFSINTGMVSNKGLRTYQRFPGLLAFDERFPDQTLKSASSPLLRTYSSHPMNRFLLGAAKLLDDGAHKVLKPIDPQIQEFLMTALDIRSSRGISIDNIQTILDVASFVSRFVDSTEDQVTLFPRLLQVCPNDEIEIAGKKILVNPRGYTYLELFALAPFGFWADVRHRPPQTYEGVPVVRPGDTERPVDPKFVYVLSRARLPKKLSISDREKRHGGCPALNPEFKKLDLINRLGRLFAHVQNEFLKLDKPMK